jgi:nicotinamidase-related amidase
MATIRESKNAALVVVDVQVGVMNKAWDAVRIIGNVAHTVERARAARG